MDQRQELHLTRDGAEYLYLIINGHLKLSMPSAFQVRHGDEKYFFAWRGPGQIIGEMSPISGEAQQIVIEAMTDCDLIEIPSTLFIEIARKNAVLFENLVKLLIQKNFDERKRWDLILSHPVGLPKVPNRAIYQVAQVLLMLKDVRGCHKDENDGHEIINGLVRHEDIAAYLGWTRQNLNKIVKYLSQNGIAKAGRAGENDASVKILDLEKLNELAPKLLKGSGSRNIRDIVI